MFEIPGIEQEIAFAKSEIPIILLVAEAKKEKAEKLFLAFNKKESMRRKIARLYLLPPKWRNHVLALIEDEKERADMEKQIQEFKKECETHRERIHDSIFAIKKILKPLNTALKATENKS